MLVAVTAETGLPAEAGRTAAGLWQAVQALRMLTEQAELLGLPVLTAVTERLTFGAMRALVIAEGEHPAKLIELIRRSC